MAAATPIAMPAAEQLTTMPASASNTRAMVWHATLCSSIISTECGTSAVTASITSGHTGLAPLVVSVPEALTSRRSP